MCSASGEATSLAQWSTSRLPFPLPTQELLHRGADIIAAYNSWRSRATVLCAIVSHNCPLWLYRPWRSTARQTICGARTELCLDPLDFAGKHSLFLLDGHRFPLPCLFRSVHLNLYCLRVLIQVRFEPVQLLLHGVHNCDKPSILPSLELLADGFLALGEGIHAGIQLLLGFAHLGFNSLLHFCHVIQCSLHALFHGGEHPLKVLFADPPGVPFHEEHGCDRSACSVFALPLARLLSCRGRHSRSLGFALTSCSCCCCCSCCRLGRRPDKAGG
mmetsp:Transcript_28658/g.66069  ORF Transcript_28658/g.66069 Transcript_28658/m.66069 type:complete len:273 (-) Transcript_28658:992-1810(-)